MLREAGSDTVALSLDATEMITDVWEIPRK